MRLCHVVSSIREELLPQRLEAGVRHADTEAQVDPVDVGESLRDVLETLICDLLAVLQGDLLEGLGPLVRS